jgi:hypothetical protein
MSGLYTPRVDQRYAIMSHYQRRCPPIPILLSSEENDICNSYELMDVLNMQASDQRFEKWMSVNSLMESNRRVVRWMADNILYTQLAECCDGDMSIERAYIVFTEFTRAYVQSYTPTPTEFLPMAVLPLCNIPVEFGYPLRIMHHLKQVDTWSPHTSCSASVPRDAAIAF